MTFEERPGYIERNTGFERFRVGKSGTIYGHIHIVNPTKNV